ncbi:MAG: serine/threonine protein kinase [Planctomycetes bacterium]|nr:serine/threonine protein kinase [Planctomycetota bacterium]
MEPDDDAELVRVLVARGALAPGSAEACLDEARRRQRAGEPTSAARLLTQQGLVPPDVVERALVEVVQRGNTVSARPASSLWPGRPASSHPSGAGAFPPRSGAWRATAPAPERLGDYRLVRLLARGGMGAVYEAVHEPSGAPRAVKLLPAAADGEARERFRREAEVMAGLDHPHVARVHAADLAGDPSYLVQDLLPGGSLQDRLRQGPLPPDEVLDLGEKVARAVAHAHALGVLHRDLKPANVLFDDRGEPRLTDFGLARRAAGASVALTATGQVLGTPAYMAPEQALGLRDVDARSDVYGLGAVLYAGLVGHEPFPGAGVAEVLERVVKEEPPRPSRLRPDVPPALEAVVLRAMAKAPDDRFPSAEALADALRAARGGAAPARPARRRRSVAPVAAGAALSLAVAIAAAWWARPTSTPAAAPAPPRAAGPAPVAAPSAPRRWSGLAPDGAFDAALSLLAECPGVGAPRLASSLLLRLEVGPDGPDGRVTLWATVRRVRVQVRGPLFALDHDGATRKGDAPEVRAAFEAVLGQRVIIEVDRDAGAVRLKDAGRLRDAVLAAAPWLPARPEATRDWAVRAFADGFEEAALTRALDALFRGAAPARFDDGRLASGLFEERLVLGGREARAVRGWHEVGVHVVGRGEVLGRIAERRDLAFPVLGVFNGIDDVNLIREGAALELPRRAPARPRRAVEVREDGLVARDRPGGLAVATLPAGRRFVSDAEDLGWARLDLGGGWAWAPLDALAPARGARAVEVATTQWVVRVERLGAARYASRGQAYVVLATGATLTEVQFDEAPASIRAVALRPVALEEPP